MPDAVVVDRPVTIEDTKRLAEALSADAQLEPLQIPDLPLRACECPYAEVEVEAWRWFATEPVYERRLVLLGGPALLGASALACVAGNRRRRRDAERAARPQWRSLGVVRVVVTDHRLLVWHEGAWWSVPFENVHTWYVEDGGTALSLSLHDGAPYRLAGGGTLLLALVILWLSEASRRRAR